MRRKEQSRPDWANTVHSPSCQLYAANRDSRSSPSEKDLDTRLKGRAYRYSHFERQINFWNDISRVKIIKFLQKKADGFPVEHDTVCQYPAGHDESVPMQSCTHWSTPADGMPAKANFKIGYSRKLSISVQQRSTVLDKVHKTGCINANSASVFSNFRFQIN